MPDYVMIKNKGNRCHFPAGLPQQMSFYKTELTLVEDMLASILKCIWLGEVQGITDIVLPQIMAQ